MPCLENTKCERRGHRLGYVPEAASRGAPKLEDDVWRALAVPGRALRFCDKAWHDACHWLVAADADTAFRAACRHGLAIPPLDDSENVAGWRKLVFAKDRLL